MRRRLWQELSALFGGSVGHPAILTFISWGAAVLAYHGHPLATQGGYAGAVAAALVFCPVLLLAYWLGAGALAFAVDAKHSCLPGSRRLARRAKFLASLLLLPALVLTAAALAGGPLWQAWIAMGLILAVALAEVLAPLRLISAAGLFLLVLLAAYWAASGRAGHERGMELFLALVAATLTLLVIAKWRRLSRLGSRPTRLAERLGTILIRFSKQRALERAPRKALSQDSFRTRQPPMQIIRTCLGGMFVRLSAPQLIVGAGLVVLVLGAAIGSRWLGATGWRWVLGALALATAGLISTGFLARISKLTREQIAELALMPGLGTPAIQRRALCTAVLAAPLLWLAMVLLLGCAGLLAKGEPLSSIAFFAVCIFIIWLAYIIFALQKLTTLPPKRQSFISEFMLLYIWIWILYPLYAVDPFSHVFHLYWWTLSIPILFGVGVAGAIGHSALRLARAPHPFLS